MAGFFSNINHILTAFLIIKFSGETAAPYDNNRPALPKLGVAEKKLCVAAS
jgi:hypothetical protein